MPATFNREFRCEQCDRRAGPEIINCPERANDACRMTIEEIGGNKLSCAGLTVGVLILAGLLVYVAQQANDPFFSVVWVVLALGFGAISLMGVLNLLSDPDNLLIDRETGASWSRITVAGRKLRTEITTAGEPVDLQLVLGRPLAYPASLVLVWSHLRSASDADIHRHAVDLVYYTLLALIADELLELRQAHRYRALLNQPLTLESSAFLLEAGARAGRVTLETTVEQRLVSAVMRWHLRDLERDKDGVIEIRPITLGWQVPPRHGLQVRHVVQELFEHEHRDPFRALVEYVQAEAQAAGLLDEAYAAARQAERAALNALHDEVAHTFPQLARDLRAQIFQGFQARQNL